MIIPILPMTSDEDNEILSGHVRFDGLSPRMDDPVKLTYTREKVSNEEGEKGVVLVMDVKGLQRRNINDVVLKRLRIRGMRTWFLTNIESVDDIFDAFNTDAEAVLVPTHTVRSREEFSDILSVSDSAIPVVFLRKGKASVMKEEMEFREAVSETFGYGFTTAAVFDLDSSLSEEMWTELKDQGDIIPCSFTGTISGKRFEELGFKRCFTVPE